MTDIVLAGWRVGSWAGAGGSWLTLGIDAWGGGGAGTVAEESHIDSAVVPSWLE